jgi:hypothetical protein
MRDPDAIDWRLLGLGPLGLIVLTVPLLAALAQITAQVPQPAPPRSWLEPLQSAERALAQGDLREAVRAGQEAYRAALTSGQWPGMIDVGDLCLRMHSDEATRTIVGPAQVRKAYLIALVRARRDGDLGGILRVAEAFANLEDDENVEYSLHIASSFAAHDSPEARELYRQTAQRLRSRGPATRPAAP